MKQQNIKSPIICNGDFLQLHLVNASSQPFENGAVVACLKLSKSEGTCLLITTIVNYFVRSDIDYY